MTRPVLDFRQSFLIIHIFVVAGVSVTYLTVLPAHLIGQLQMLVVKKTNFMLQFMIKQATLQVMMLMLRDSVHLQLSKCGRGYLRTLLQRQLRVAVITIQMLSSVVPISFTGQIMFLVVLTGVQILPQVQTTH